MKKEDMKAVKINKKLWADVAIEDIDGTIPSCNIMLQGCGGCGCGGCYCITLYAVLIC